MPFRDVLELRGYMVPSPKINRARWQRPSSRGPQEESARSLNTQRVTCNNDNGLRCGGREEDVGQYATLLGTLAASALAPALCAEALRGGDLRLASESALYREKIRFDAIPCSPQTRLRASLHATPACGSPR